MKDKPPFMWLGAEAETADVLECYEMRSEVYSPPLVDLDDPQAFYE
jgi:hypothetical protein